VFKQGKDTITGYIVVNASWTHGRLQNVALAKEDRVSVLGKATNVPTITIESGYYDNDDPKKKKFGTAMTTFKQTVAATRTYDQEKKVCRDTQLC